MPYRDRRAAGRELGARLTERRAAGGLEKPVVLALPRGGLPVADEVAQALGAPLDLVVVRKIGLPGNPEFAVGAVAGEDDPWYDERTLRTLHLTRGDLSAEAGEAREEIHRREGLYREGRPPPALTGRTAILVDDGLATGSTARVALRAVRRRGPARVVLAVPVGSAEAVAVLGPEADEVICLSQPSGFQAVGQFYQDFAQVGDEEVVRILRAAVTPDAPDAPDSPG
ncbi:phosphoribosyltransferase [Streptomyces zingiberis]|uniref:Phosphoribosyltransferase n=1 Tax=Streptomyces zingiberis TaxID=2053010 RepID=A0ABX1BRH9_9ACTN|nr:phosphoribosyltransferase family protein [Streptomyces zingiberis]NJQ00344.1 phosphoribosyltransferase [Streptomyces zingiberis]